MNVCLFISLNHDCRIVSSESERSGDCRVDMEVARFSCDVQILEDGFAGVAVNLVVPD